MVEYDDQPVDFGSTITIRSPSVHFAGWVDVDVSAKGAEEAVNAGRWGSEGNILILAHDLWTDCQSTYVHINLSIVNI